MQMGLSNGTACRRLGIVPVFVEDVGGVRRSRANRRCFRCAQHRAPVRAGQRALLTALLAAFGRAIAEVGAIIIASDNIRVFTRAMTTAIVLETGEREPAAGTRSDPAGAELTVSTVALLLVGGVGKK